MKNKAAQQLGRLGGKVSSQAKADAVRENGKKGGRPVLALQQRLEKVLDTGTPLRMKLPNGQRVRVIYADGFLRALTVASQQSAAALIIESNSVAEVAKELRNSGHCA
jgi:hypothetical protein